MSNLKYYNLFSNLKFVTRFSGLNLIQPEKLESHVIELIGLAFDLYYGVGGFELNKLIYLITIHDLDESVTVDIPRPFKYSSRKFYDALKSATRDFLVNLNIDENIISDIESAKSQGKEGKLLSLIDLFQVKCKIDLEISLGNSRLGELKSNIEDYLKVVANRNEELIPYLKYLSN